MADAPDAHDPSPIHVTIEPWLRPVDLVADDEGHLWRRWQAQFLRLLPRLHLSLHKVRREATLQDAVDYPVGAVQ